MSDPVQRSSAVDASNKHTHRFAIAVILSLIAFAIYSLPSHSRQGVDAGGDTGAAEILPIALLKYHALDFNTFLQHYRLPDNNDGASLPYYLTRVNGRVISFYPIVPGLMNVPVYWIADRAGIDLFSHRYQLSAITSAGVTALSVGAIFLALRCVCRTDGTAIFFSLVYAFATTAWSVCSRTLWQHGPAMLLLSAALAMLLSREQRWIARSGFFLALAVWTRPTVVLIALPIGVYVLIHHRQRLLAFLLWAAIPAIGMAGYSHLYCGSVLSLGQGRNIVQDTTGPDTTYGTGWVGLAGILVSPSRGLFVFTPVFTASFILMFTVFHRRHAQRLYPYLAAAVLLYIGLISQWKVWWGGYCFGYRLLCEIVPMLILFLAEAWQRWIAGHRGRVFQFLVLLALSVYFNALGAFYYPTSFNNVPQSVNTDPHRLWDPRDCELVRCQRSAF